MVNWQGDTMETRLLLINMNMSFLLLGLYGWEYLQTLDVEYAVLRGRLSFKWPLVPYLIGRMFLLIFLVLLTVRASVPENILNCLPGAIATAVTGNIGLACSSANLMIRTWVIWKESRWVHVLLLLLSLGHWIVLGFDVANLELLHTKIGQCVIHITRPNINAIVFMYSLGFDFTILVLSIVGLSRQRSKSSLGKRLRSQGLMYFGIAVVTYITPTVFGFLGVNSMVSLTGLSAITASTIASYRAVRSLLGMRGPAGQSTVETGETEVALTTEIPVHTATPPSDVV